MKKYKDLDFEDPDAVLQYMFTNEISITSNLAPDVEPKTFEPNFLEKMHLKWDL